MAAAGPSSPAGRRRNAEDAAPSDPSTRMTPGPRLQQRQTQRLAMTPRLQQSIRLLQMGGLELEAFVESQLEENPLLRRERADDGDAGEPARTDADARPAGLEGGFRSPDWFSGAPWGGGGYEGGPDLENRLAEEPGLRALLERQLLLEIADGRDRLIGRALIDALDPSGWLTADLAAFAEALGAPLAEVERVLARLQQFEPAGLFARSLAECLALQLRDRGRWNAAWEALLAHLPLLARRELDALQGHCGVDRATLLAMVRELRSLDPKPGLAFDGEAAPAVIPDILVEAHPAGGWAVALNDRALPRVIVDRDYHARIGAGMSAPADRRFLAERLDSASWLVRALHQRAETMLKVASELVRRQEAFLARGVLHLRPLVLREVADAVGVHESTVSRVTANKHMHTPRGLFELRYFFTAAIPGADGGPDHSAEAVRHRLKALIEAENPAKPLSDDSLALSMRSEGIRIARRTVAKYRETLHIPSAAGRRRARAAML